jgi:hypothetical protein
MISDIVSQHNRRRQLNELDCDGIDTSPVSTSCVPVTEIIIVDGRRGCVRTSCICQFLLHVRYIIVVVLLYSLQEGCQQCTGVDDDDDTASYSHNDESGGDRRQMSGYDSGYEGAYLTFTVTAQVPTGEDPLVVMNEVEGLIVEYFSDVDESSSTWLARAKALGADIPEDTRIIFSEPEVENDSIHISRPGDFIDHHYNSNSNVRVGTWVGASLAGLALVLSAKYGVKAYRLQHDAAELEKEKASEWANIEEAEGDVTLNPLAGGDGAVRHRSNSGGVA